MFSSNGGACGNVFGLVSKRLYQCFFSLLHYMVGWTKLLSFFYFLKVLSGYFQIISKINVWIRFVWIYIYIYIYIYMLCICIKVYIYRQKNDIYTLYFGLFQTLICNYAFICIDIYYNMYIMLYIKKLKMKSKTSAKTYLNLKYIFR